MQTAFVRILLVSALLPAYAWGCGTPTSDEPLRSTQEQRASPINSEAALTVYLGDLPFDSPLLALSESSRNRFATSITFSASGVTGFSYADIERELSVSQAHAVLELIGSQRVIAKLPQLKVRTDLDRSIRAAMVGRCAEKASAPTAGRGNQGFK